MLATESPLQVTQQPQIPYESSELPQSNHGESWPIVRTIRILENFMEAQDVRLERRCNVEVRVKQIVPAEHSGTLEHQVTTHADCSGFITLPSRKL